MSNAHLSRTWPELTLARADLGRIVSGDPHGAGRDRVSRSVAHRVLWAALALWLVIVAPAWPLPRDRRIWGAFLVMGCLNNVIPFSLMAWGQLHIETGLTAILNAATAIWGVLVAALVFADERLTSRRLAGSCSGFAAWRWPSALRNLAAFDLRSLAQLAVIRGTISYALRRKLGARHAVGSVSADVGGGDADRIDAGRCCRWRVVVEGPLPA